MEGSHIPPALAHEWSNVVRALEDPNVELDADTFAAFLATWKRMTAAGFNFDRGFVALVGMLERQVVDGDEDGDSDHADALVHL